jgi:demethylspheroidene O-methyltransferase
MHDAWLSLRNRLLASETFQRLAIAFPLTRGISRKRSRALFDIVAGFTYSQVLYAVVKLDLISVLDKTSQTTETLAAQYNFEPDQLFRLLKASESLDILERTKNGAWTLGVHGAALAGNPWIMRFIMHHDLLYRDAEDPLSLLRDAPRDTALKQFWSYAQSDGAPDAAQQDVKPYTELMAASQIAVAGEMLAIYDFGSYRHVMDVGGSNGTFLLELAKDEPLPQLTLFDLPPVASLAEERVNQAGLTHRIRVLGGSFLSDSLPEGADLVTLIRILHDHDDGAVLKLLSAVRKVLPENGALLVAEPLSGVRSIAPVADAYFGLYFAAMGQGKTRTEAEIANLAKMAGFSKSRLIPTRMPLITGLVELRP